MLTISAQSLPSLSFSLHRRHVSFFPNFTTLTTTKPYHFPHFPLSSTESQSTFVEHLTSDKDFSQEEKWDLTRSSGNESGLVGFDVGEAGTEMRRFGGPSVEVKELEELPEQWRRSKIAWLCKELPTHKAGTIVRLLNGHKKWLKQDDATYLAVHFMRIRENETGFRVYIWMVQQHWYRFDFALATKLADYMGKERKFAKCREIFDHIINQGRVPSESTFHILIVAYLSAPVQGCLDEACIIYNHMIQLGGYQPRLSLHNSLFRALISKPEGSSKYYLPQAEFIFHNLVTSGLEVQKDIYSGLIWLHSYQESIDKERIASLRKEMKQAGIEEGNEILLSILRVCGKEGDVEEAERTWLRLLESDSGIPTPAFVYKMEAYGKIGEYVRSLDIFREMQERFGSASVPAYHKIIELLCKSEEVELAESLMKEFVESGMKPLMPTYIDLTNMYLNLGMHDKLHLVFSECLERCRPNSTMYGTYLQSLVKVGNLEKAEEIFSKMHNDEAIGVNTVSCNTILSAYLSSEDHQKAKKIYDFMLQKKYDVEPTLMEKIDYILSLSSREFKKPVSLKLSPEQREKLIGLLLGGLCIESDDKRKRHMILFEFNEKSRMHSVLRRHVYHHFHEWLHPSKQSDSSDDVPYKFCTIPHLYFGFYADQFWPKGELVIPKLIHRWLSPRVLAFWFMYGGHRTSDGDILLKLKGSTEGVAKIVKTLQAKSIDCKVKKKGRVFWIGFLGSNSTLFWNMIEPYVPYELKEDFLKEGSETRTVETKSINFDIVSDSDE